MAAKINDGLFIGDFDTSQDVEFLELNKISSLINLAGKQLPNIFASHGIVYMTVDWEDREDFVLFPSQGVGGHGITHSAVIKEMVHFIDKCQKHGTSVLLFSVNGTGRCAAAASCYLMCKYGWGFEKAYDFLFAKKPDLELNRGFVEQLFKLDKELRRQKYHSLNNISPLENERLTGWNVDYVTAGLGENPSPAEEAMATEEILMINSFNNSKLTITTLPGPYENAMRQFKNFKLQFNLRRNQEAGVHLKRTSPKAPNYQPPRGGILKGGRTHCPPHLRPAANSPTKMLAQGGSSSPSSTNGFSQSRANSNSRQVLEDSSDEEEEVMGSNRRGQGQRSSGQTHQHQQQESKRGHDSPQAQDDSLLFGGSISLLSAGKDTTDSVCDNQQLAPSDSMDYYYDRPFQPQESVQSQNSQGSDLYDFVGLQSSSKTSSNYMDMLSLDSRDEDGSGTQQQPRRREAKDASRKKPVNTQSAGGFQDRRVRRTEAKQSAPSSNSSTRVATGATPEERLHSLLGDLQRGGGSKKSATTGSTRDDARNDDTTSYESSSKQRADRGYRSEAKRSGSAQRDGASGRQGTTVHDVANMNIQPAYYQNGMSVTGQPVVAKPHTTAWGEQTASSSERARVQSERKQKTASSRQYRSNTAGSTYRHGSPAPQVPSGGLSGRVKSSRESASSAGQRGGSNQPLRRHGDADRERTQGPRYATPTRSASRQKDAPGAAPSSARRGTPTRERQPTPTRERHSTPTRQRPATPDRSRGWKY